MKRGIWITWIVLVAGAAACSDADVAGTYTASITNRSDSCSLGLTPGNNASATFNVTQSGSDVTFVIEGLAGGFITIQTGMNILTGSVDGNDISVERKGTIETTLMACKYTINVRIKASQDGDAMQGRVEYRSATNNSPDCGTHQDCLTVQDFNATRPPPAK
jgi:hypothetical protein